jgi:hypothetical protein
MELQSWELGGPGRGILIDPDGEDPTLVLWRLEESGLPWADEVIRHLGLTAQTVVRFDIEDGGGVRNVVVASASQKPPFEPDGRRLIHILAGLDRRLRRDIDWEEMFNDPELWGD